MAKTTAARAETLLGVKIVATTAMAGGMICSTTRLKLSDGRSAVFKSRPGAPQGFFAAEASGLEALRSSHGVQVPEVLAVSDDCIIIEWVDTTRPSVDAAERFARSLAATHKFGVREFGGQLNGFIATLPLPNKPSDSWPEFYASRRVMPYLKLAVDRAAILPEEAAVIEALMHRLPEFAGEEEPPALLHGDLWNGNVLFASTGTPYVIDPAVHGGHRETDLAMLQLFGLPFLDRVLDAYDEVFPLQDGWKDRVGIHQIHPLLVHAVIFGGSYGQKAARTAQTVLNGVS